MNLLQCSALSIVLVLSDQAFAEVSDLDTALSGLATTLGGRVKEQQKKKIAVIDFTDLQGAALGELGKYIAEQLTVNLVMEKRDFAVLDRANLRRILAEHKLTSQGLVDPDNAKKLGMFAGVDALILGTVVPKGQTSMGLTAKIITTDTAEIVGAARSEFKADSVVEQLMIHTGSAADRGADTWGSDPPSVGKSLGDLRVELQSLRIVSGTRYQLTMSMSNQNTKKSIWVALLKDPSKYGPKGGLTDAAGTECFIDGQSLSGIQVGSESSVYENAFYVHYSQVNAPPHKQFTPALELKPGEVATATLKFLSSTGKQPEAGTCTVQLEFLLGHDFAPGLGSVAPENLVAKVEVQSKSSR